MGSSQWDIRLLPVQNAGLNQEPQGPIFEAWNTWTLKLLFGTMPWVRNLHFQHISPGISQHTWPSSTFSLNFQACSSVGKWQTGLGVFNKRRSKKNGTSTRGDQWEKYLLEERDCGDHDKGMKKPLELLLVKLRNAFALEEHNRGAISRRWWISDIGRMVQGERWKGCY